MNIPPLLEKLLLSNEATFKNASLGLSGQNMVFCPPGKTIVILELKINPFINNITDAMSSWVKDGTIPDFTTGDFNSFLRKFIFQVQIINDNYSTYLNVVNAFSLKQQHTGGQIRDSFMDLHFNGFKEDLFIYQDRSLYFNIIYPYRENDEDPPDTGFNINYNTPTNAFLPKIQNLPKSTITFYNNNFVDYVYNVTVNTPSGDHYYPVGHQTNPSFASELPQMEYLRIPILWPENTIQIPAASGLEYKFWGQLLQVPFINVKYALLNKRPQDYGITMPTL